ncbi:hypothetical protein BaRGS_00018992 [Batillaria attramentaria]|uniref:Uncharacterized protein n=1 Tax=Batillaria attramentaria TaxID=370345 RepID=A0ABD0KRA3_9CAEN
MHGFAWPSPQPSNHCREVAIKGDYKSWTVSLRPVSAPCSEAATEYRETNHSKYLTAVPLMIVLNLTLPSDHFTSSSPAGLSRDSPVDIQVVLAAAAGPRGGCWVTGTHLRNNMVATLHLLHQCSFYCKHCQKMLKYWSWGFFLWCHLSASMNAAREIRTKTERVSAH